MILKLVTFEILLEDRFMVEKKAAFFERLIFSKILKSEIGGEFPTVSRKDPGPYQEKLPGCPWVSHLLGLNVLICKMSWDSGAR